MVAPTGNPNGFGSGRGLAFTEAASNVAPVDVAICWAAAVAGTLSAKAMMSPESGGFPGLSKVEGSLRVDRKEMHRAVRMPA